MNQILTKKYNEYNVFYSIEENKNKKSIILTVNIKKNENIDFNKFIEKITEKFNKELLLINEISIDKMIEISLIKKNLINKIKSRNNLNQNEPIFHKGVHELFIQQEDFEVNKEKISNLFDSIKKKYEVIKKINNKLPNNFNIEFNFNLTNPDNSNLFLFCSDHKSNINTETNIKIFPIFKLLLYSLDIQYSDKSYPNQLSSEKIISFLKKYDQQYLIMAQSIHLPMYSKPKTKTGFFW